jgi:hypothetical protein
MQLSLSDKKKIRAVEIMLDKNPDAARIWLGERESDCNDCNIVHVYDRNGLCVRNYERKKE